MKVLLIHAAPDKKDWPMGQFRSQWIPTGIAYLAAAVIRAGHEVRVHLREEHLIESGFDWLDADEGVRKLLTEFRPEVVGFSVMTPAVSDADAIAGWAKQLVGDHVMTVAGGPHPTALPDRMLAECPSIDVVVIGEGEQTLVELIERGPQADVAGLVYRDGPGLVHTAPRPNPTDLDSLGPPPYDLFNMDFHTRPNPWMIRWLTLPVVNIRTSRGCPNRCRFCAGHVISGLGVRRHSVGYVIDQINTVVNRFGTEAVLFEDDTMASDREWLVSLCRAICDQGLHRRIKWCSCLRVDQVEPELLDCMKQAGCIQIEYGFESGSDRMLRSLGKNSSVEMNRRAVTLTRRAGVRVFADIMVGLPGETEEEFNDTIRFLRWARPEVISATRLIPLPGTAIFNELPESVRDDMDWSQYAYDTRFRTPLNLTAMPDKQFERIHRAFRKYFTGPQSSWALWRDSPGQARKDGWKLARELLGFVLRHPIRAARVPW